MLTVPVVLIPRRVPRAVREGQQLTVTAPCHLFCTARRVLYPCRQLTRRVIIAVPRCLTAARGLRRQPSLLIILPAAAKPVRVRHRRHLPLAVIAIPYRPAVRPRHRRHRTRRHMQAVLRPPPRRIRLCLQPPRLIILAAGNAPVRMFLLHHPLQATLAFRVQHLPPVQAVRDDYPALSVLKAVVQPLRVDLLRHPTGIIIPVAALRPPRIMVRHHPPGVLRIISKPAHLRSAAVIHRPQFTTGRVRVARQRRSRLFIRVCRVVCQPYRLQPDTVIRAVSCTGGQRVGENQRRGSRTGTGRGR
ncbi:hypothetical protein L342_2573 [Escherichia coli CE516]|nr:hypothetical protein L342_2573 [Escherichia coli CE516]